MVFKGSKEYGLIWLNGDTNPNILLMGDADAHIYALNYLHEVIQIDLEEKQYCIIGTIETIEWGEFGDNMLLRIHHSHKTVKSFDRYDITDIKLIRIPLEGD